MAKINVRLYGLLSEKLGIKKLKLDVTDTAEVIRALCALFPSFRLTLQNGRYTLRTARQYLTEETLQQGLDYRLKDGDSVHIIPEITGAKNGGIFSSIVGGLIIAGAFFASGGTATALFAIGGSMMLQGAVQLLTRIPKADSMNEAKKESSTSFGNLQNLAAQGKMIPLAYGEIRTGSLVISQGVTTETIGNLKIDLSIK